MQPCTSHSSSLSSTSSCPYSCSISASFNNEVWLAAITAAGAGKYISEDFIVRSYRVIESHRVPGWPQTAASPTSARQERKRDRPQKTRTRFLVDTLWD